MKKVDIGLGDVIAFLTLITGIAWLANRLNEGADCGCERRRVWLNERVRFLFAWYDFWMGAFWDGEKRRLYLFPVPMFGMQVNFTEREKRNENQK